MKKKWILALYLPEDREEAEIYRTAFEDNGFGWETLLSGNSILLADAVFFLCHEKLFEEPDIKEAYETCIRRDIPVILAERDRLNGQALQEAGTVYDAAELSFEDLKEKLSREDPVPITKPESSRKANIFSVLFVVLALLSALWLLVRISPQSVPVPEEEITEQQRQEQFGDAVVQVWSIGSFGGRVYRGSGFAVSSTGYILTNAHVVDHPSSRYCAVYMDRVLNAEVIALSPEHDLALLKTEHTLQHTLQFARTKTEKNTPVYVIGYPESQGKTVTAGFYEGTQVAGSDYETIRVVLKHGNSGSPVCTNEGKVIGIASAVLGEDEETGLMIPAETCTAFLKDYVFLEGQR